MGAMITFDIEILYTPSGELAVLDDFIYNTRIGGPVVIPVHNLAQAQDTIMAALRATDHFTPSIAIARCDLDTIPLGCLGGVNRHTDAALDDDDNLRLPRTHIARLWGRDDDDNNTINPDDPVPSFYEYATYVDNHPLVFDEAVLAIAERIVISKHSDKANYDCNALLLEHFIHPYEGLDKETVECYLEEFYAFYASWKGYVDGNVDYSEHGEKYNVFVDTPMLGDSPEHAMQTLAPFMQGM